MAKPANDEGGGVPGRSLRKKHVGGGAGLSELAAAATTAAIAALEDNTPPDWLDAHEHKIGAHALTFGGVVVKVHDPLTVEESKAIGYFDVVHLSIERRVLYLPVCEIFGNQSSSRRNQKW